MKGFIMITTADAVVTTGGGLTAVSWCDQLPGERKVMVGHTLFIPVNQQ
jgi:hypothetical protein